MKTSFFLIFTAITVSVCSFPSTAQDSSQIGLPEGAIVRIGKGALGEVHFSPDGSQLAISTRVAQDGTVLIRRRKTTLQKE